MKNTIGKYFIFIILLNLIFSANVFAAKNLLGQYDFKNQLYISEFLAVNGSSLADFEGEYADWIEIHNPLLTEINLNGWYLTDDKSELTKWSFRTDVSIPADGYLLVFASGKDTIVEGEVHTGFKLSGEGEYLALVSPDGISIVYEITFETQKEDISGGILNSEFYYFTEPTPGKANIQKIVIDPPKYTLPSGFYNKKISVGLYSNLPGATIYYTTDNSEPSDEMGNLYTNPIEITSTTIIRANLITSEGETSPYTLGNYFYLDSILAQSDTIPGYPLMWGPHSRNSDTARADYEMDPRLCQDLFLRTQVKDALLALPTISIVTEKDYLFSHDTSAEEGGIYIYTGPPTGGLGKGWERPASIEYFFSDSTEGFKVNCALEIHGGHSRLPEKSPKHSFRLSFKSKYGESRLKYPLFGDEATDDFDVLVLRAGFCNSWVHLSSDQRSRAQYIRDSWAKDTQLDIGHLGAHNNFAHLYLNGLYWGIYNISERINDEFLESYLGGDEKDYDVIKDYTEVAAGNIDAWNEMIAILRSDSLPNNKYMRLLGLNPDGSANPQYRKYLDPVNYIDYMLINYYAGSNDWDHHNWVAGRNRNSDSEGFKFFCWDSEHIMESLNGGATYITNTNCPTEIIRWLKESNEFRFLLAQRVEELLFNEGALTPEAVAERWLKKSDVVENAILAESARWGDVRGGSLVYNKDNFWLPEKNSLLNSYFPERTERAIKELVRAGLYHGISAPEYNHQGGVVERNFTLEVYSDAEYIVYTLDGSDPRELGGGISKKAHIYSSEIPVMLQNDAIVRARGLTGNADWTSDKVAKFIVADGFWESIAAGISDHGNFPNPFWEKTEIYYTLPLESDISISLYSVYGKKISAYSVENQMLGRNSWVLNAENLESGIYIYVIQSENYSVTGKLSHLQ